MDRFTIQIEIVLNATQYLLQNDAALSVSRAEVIAGEKQVRETIVCPFF